MNHPPFGPEDLKDPPLAGPDLDPHAGLAYNLRGTVNHAKGTTPAPPAAAATAAGSRATPPKRRPQNSTGRPLSGVTPR